MKKKEQVELFTVQEFAERAGVSVQAIYKRLNNSLNPYIQLVDGRKMLKSSALSDVYGIEVEQLVQPELNKEKSSSEVDFLRKQVEQLQTELSKERQHSRELAERIVVLADQAQKLQLAQISPQLIEGAGCVADPVESESTPPPQQRKPEQKKRWWSRIFG